MPCALSASCCMASAELAPLLIALWVQGIAGAQQGSPGSRGAARQRRHQSLRGPHKLFTRLLLTMMGP